MGEFGRAEADAVCPVSLETLGELRNAEPAEFNARVSKLSEERQILLALFCYNRAHFREVSLKIAAMIDPARLGELAGMMGQILATQSRAMGQSFGIEDTEPKRGKPKPKISLGGRG